MGNEDQKPPAVGWLLWGLTVLIVVTVAGGIAAAAIGGSWSDLGSGYGGLYGVPAILMTLMALSVIPVAVLVARRLSPDAGGLRIAVLVGAGLWVVTLGYSQIAHIVDPCANGWWDHRSQIGSQPLCERFGSELNWHTRFHLLAHAAPAAVLLAVYIFAIKRWGRADEPAQKQDSRSSDLRPHGIPELPGGDTRSLPDSRQTTPPIRTQADQP